MDILFCNIHPFSEIFRQMIKFKMSVIVRITANGKKTTGFFRCFKYAVKRLHTELAAAPGIQYTAVDFKRNFSLCRFTQGVKEFSITDTCQRIILKFMVSVGEQGMQKNIRQSRTDRIPEHRHHKGSKFFRNRRNRLVGKITQLKVI